MKLDRNTQPTGTGKYALIKMRNWPKGEPESQQVTDALLNLASHGMLDYGCTPETEFFVMRLKDKFSYKGLMGYQRAILDEEKPDVEYAQEIFDMARRSGPNSPHCKLPD